MIKKYYGKKKIGFIYGTRPEIIKLGPIMKSCKKKKIPFFSIHTGQHYSYKMNEIFFDEFDLPIPEYMLHIKSEAPYKQGNHTGRMLIRIEDVLLKEMPFCVVVQGDTNSALAGALTAEKISTTKNYTGFHIKVAHVEAGLRSYDRTMPEEINRFIADHLSDFLFTPTAKEKKILIKEGVPKTRIFITGNTIVDAVKQSLTLARQNSAILKNLGLRKNSYILLTLHRQENVDSKKVFTNLLRGLSLVRHNLKLPIIFSMHPRTGKMLKRFKLKIPKHLTVIEPTGFLDFIWLEANATLVLTDSGGVQEETCILKVPCVTLRNNTERSETVEVGSNVLAGTEPETILKCAKLMLDKANDWKNPFGDGESAEKIVKILSLNSASE